MKKIYVLCGLLYVISFCGMAQDFHYSQFYSAPLYLNPALTGSTELSRMGLNYRKQWPGLPQDFTAYSAYFDHYSFDLNSGFGLAINSFQESNMNIKTSDASFLYAYTLRLAETWNFRFGWQASVVQRNAGLDHLIFGDQVDLFSRSISPGTLDLVPDFDPYTYLDLGFGALLHNEYFWLGAAAQHINKPRLSFYPDDWKDYLPVKWGFHGGWNFPLGANGYGGSDFDNHAAILLSYKRQGPFQQIDVGSQWVYKSLVSGVSFRGIPGLRNMPNRDSFIFLLGLRLDNGMVMGYSYDFMISKIGLQTKGAHEISLRYQFLMGDPRYRNRKSTILKCFQYLL